MGNPKSLLDVRRTMKAITFCILLGTAAVALAKLHPIPLGLKSCAIKDMRCYSNDNLSNHYISTKDPLACQRLCSEADDCAVWNLSPKGLCTSQKNIDKAMERCTYAKGYITGGKHCGCHTNNMRCADPQGKVGQTDQQSGAWCNINCQANERCEVWTVSEKEGCILYTGDAWDHCEKAEGYKSGRNIIWDSFYG